MKLLENTRRFRKTKKGVLTNMYDHMKRRNNVEFSLEDFHKRFLEDRKFIRLYSEWVSNDFKKQFKPSLDRIDSRSGYTIKNTQMLSWAENRFKQSKLDGKRGRKPAVLQMMGNKVVRRFLSQRHVVRELGIPQGNLSSVLNGKRNHIHGYSFVYENSELLNNQVN